MMHRIDPCNNFRKKKTLELLLAKSQSPARRFKGRYRYEKCPAPIAFAMLTNPNFLTRDCPRFTNLLQVGGRRGFFASRDISTVHALHKPARKHTIVQAHQTRLIFNIFHYLGTARCSAPSRRQSGNLLSDYSQDHRSTGTKLTRKLPPARANQYVQFDTCEMCATLCSWTKPRMAHVGPERRLSS